MIRYLMITQTMRADPGSNQGPLDLQSNALPTELSARRIIPADGTRLPTRATAALTLHDHSSCLSRAGRFLPESIYVGQGMLVLLRVARYRKVRIRGNPAGGEYRLMVHLKLRAGHVPATSNEVVPFMHYNSHTLCTTSWSSGG